MYICSCSVPCSRKHKEQPCVPYEEETIAFPAPPKNRDGSLPLKHRILQDEAAAVEVKDSELELLDNDTDVQMKLGSSRLRHTLRVILDADNSLDALDMAMKDGDFLEFCDQVLSCIGYHDNDSGGHEGNEGNSSGMNMTFT